MPNRLSATWAVTRCLVLLAAFVSPVGAQQFTATIQGVVHDATGAVIAGADLSVININTNETRHVTTDRDGAYVVPQLKPGDYRIVVERTGFKTATVDGIKLDVQQTRAVDVRLEVGGTKETVTVSATVAPIETVSSTISQTIENRRVVDLPLNGRNPFSLATLSPGVIPAPGSSPFISGGRNATSEVTIDGISNVNAENNVSILDLNYTPSVDAVQEFSVQTNAVSAEFGRLGGGVINLVTKSGTSQFRGTLFGFLRDSALDANNFFSNRAGIRKGDFRRKQFGGNTGGPIRRGRTFFFVNYEGLRQGTANVGTFTVPLPEWRQGDFSNLKNAAGQPVIIYDPLTTRPDPNNPGRFIRSPFPNNVIPAARINPIARRLMSYWPLPNTAPTNVNTAANNYAVAGTSVSENNQIDSRVDHEFSGNWRAFVRFSSLFKAPNRPFNAYGPRQSARAIIPAIIGQALTRDVVELGALTPIRDLTFVSDTVEGFLRVAETPGAIGETINIGTGKGITIGDLAARILSRLGVATPIRIAQERVRPASSEVMALICDNRKADNLLNWRPQVTLDAGLDAVIEWMRTSRAAAPPEIYQV